MFSLSLNGLAVLLSVVAQGMLGSAWYLGVIPKPYALALGRTDLAGRKPGALFIAGPQLCMLVVTLANAVLLRALHIDAMPEALVFGAISGAGYLAATVFNVAINPNIPRPLLYGVINAPYFLLSNLVSCAILTAMA
ncbi:DUF1761 domain-containing protein [Comamonas sp. JC664]|uniref:DUF1761 domain-containing protein n=1 Tax=Comamonas sp. JC664 TaxID=2801917 RepID=UPI00174D50FC|nr:DUF1761 domain-containing protein [Comamonas sp. JC664]MBL0695852.1 DUF1761 domain-containing protein [Comamonas sp. JC664]GHG63851.1 hypothetical protein GCM10012319_03790 [Comamonas sp. KCTC 72670]